MVWFVGLVGNVFLEDRNFFKFNKWKKSGLKIIQSELI